MQHRDAVFVIEALRAGIPTRLSTQFLPDLRKNVSLKFAQDLALFDEGECPPGRLLWGQYGQGKTHALTALEHQALEHNFAVSRISLSRDVSCYQLQAFYAALASRIRRPKSSLEGMAVPFRQLRPAEVLQSQIFSEGRYIHTLPVKVLEAYLYSEGESREKLYADLAGSRLPAPTLKQLYRQATGKKLSVQRFLVGEHAFAYFGLMADLIQLCGYEGWVILIDEIELLGRLGKKSRLKAYQNLNWLLNWGKSHTFPLYCIAAAATRLQDDLWYGKTNDDRSVMPDFAASLALPDQAQSARTQMQNFFSLAIGKAALSLLPPREDELIALLDEICALHAAAYNWDAQLDSRSLLRQLGAQAVRSYVRAALEYLDLQQQYGGAVLPTANDYVQAELCEDREYEQTAEREPLEECPESDRD